MTSFLTQDFGWTTLSWFGIALRYPREKDLHSRRFWRVQKLNMILPALKLRVLESMHYNQEACWRNYDIHSEREERCALECHFPSANTDYVVVAACCCCNCRRAAWSCIIYRNFSRALTPCVSGHTSAFFFSCFPSMSLICPSARFLYMWYKTFAGAS